MTGLSATHAAHMRADTLHLALPVFERVPEGCRLFPVRDGRHAPHLKTGEVAVIDATDTDIAFGELYLVEQSRGPVIWQVTRARNAESAMLRPLAGLYGSFAEAVAAVNSGRCYMSDGPVGLDYLRENILGRVVGIYDGPPLPQLA